MEITTKDLEERNPCYAAEHGVTESDADRATFMAGRIKASRDDTKPKAGDTVIMIGPKRTYERGYLQNDDPSSFSAMCTQPYVPFVCVYDDRDPSFDASGGYWFSAKDGETLRLVGKGERAFKAWGHCGPCAGGAFTFLAEVNVWEMRSDRIY